MNKTQVIANAKRIMDRRFPEWVKNHGGCFYWAAATVGALRLAGERTAQVQAGTCYWPRLTPELAALEPDPVHLFGYEWEPDSEATRLAIMENRLPEMHVWVAVPANNLIIDLTSGQFPVQCKRLIGLDWPGPIPPNHLWCKADPERWLDNVAYQPDVRAIELVMNYFERTI